MRLTLPCSAAMRPGRPPCTTLSAGPLAPPQRTAHMPKSSIQKWCTVVLILNFVMSAGCAHMSRAQDPKAEIGFIDINADMQLRRMMVHHARPKGVVLFLHGPVRTSVSPAENC